MTTTSPTLAPAPPVTLAGRAFTTEVQTHDSGRSTLWLTGKRGGVFFLRPFLGEQTGEHQVIAWKTGAPLRDKAGREVRALWIGDVIEEIAR